MPLPIEEPLPDGDPLCEDQEPPPLRDPEPEEDEEVPDPVGCLPLVVAEGTEPFGIDVAGAVDIGALHPDPDIVPPDHDVADAVPMGFVGLGLDIRPWYQLLDHRFMAADPEASPGECQRPVLVHEDAQDRVGMAEADLTVLKGAECLTDVTTIGAVTIAAAAIPAAILVSMFQVCGCVRTIALC